MTPVTAKNASLTQPIGFEDEVRRQSERTGAALAALIAAVPPAGHIHRPADLEKALKLSTTLAWQVFRAANAGESLIDAGNLPGPGAMKKVFQAAARRKVSARTISAASAAVEDFYGLIKRHASDRDAFSSMLSGLAGGEAESIDLVQRRTAYKTSSHVLGMQARTQLAWCAQQPNAQDPNRMDYAILRGFHGWRRFGATAPLILSRTRFSDDTGAALPTDPRPLVVTDQTDKRFSLLPEFCTKPLPSLRTIPANLGMMNIEVEGSDVGNQSALTCITGEVMYGASDRYRSPDDEFDRSQVLARTPCELLVLNILIREDTYGPIAPRVAIYTDHACPDPNIQNAARERDLLPQREAVEYLGRGSRVLSDRDVPRHAEMSQYAFDQLGWDGERFDVYQCRVEYPIVPSSVVVSFPLPEKPQA